jgi:hypothetical protein
MIDDLFEYLDLEFKVDNLALSFLKEVDKDPYSMEVKNIFGEIMILIKDQSGIVFEINCLGNLGVALRSIINNGLLSEKYDQIFVVTNSFYCLTKHINDPFMFEHPKLYISRALLIYENLDIFKMKNERLDKISRVYEKEHVLLSIAYNELIKCLDFSDFVEISANSIKEQILSNFGGILKIEEKVMNKILNLYYLNFELVLKSNLQKNEV